MKNIKFFVLTLLATFVSSVYAETMYVVSGKCNIPLTKGMSSATYQIFTWDGTTATKTTDVTCSPNGTGATYYNSTSLALSDLKNTSNYSSGSSSNRTMQAIKLASGNTLTVSVGSKTMSKIIVAVRPASNDQLSLDVLGETISSKSSASTYIVEKEQSFTGDILIANNTTGKEYHFFIYLIEGAAGPVAVTGVTLNKTSTSIEAGQSETLVATVAPSNAANQNVSWSSSNPSVATVDDNGLVTALTAGQTTITVTTEDGNKTATCAVTVTAPAAPIPVTAISLNKSATTISIGASETLTITYTPADANTGKAVNWTSSDTGVATVDNSGKVTGVAAGTATITATSATDPAITASCAVTVQAVAVTGVSLNKTSTSIKVGNTETLTATITPADATNKTLTWSSDKPNVASVANGVVTANDEGTAVITVTTQDGNKTATCTVTVTAAAPVPPTTLTLHTPGIYEARIAEGGYATAMKQFQSRMYEVYYAGRMDQSGTKLTIHTTPADKSQGITKNESTSSYEAVDGWFKGSGSDKGTGFDAKDEFVSATERCHNMKASNSIEIHIKGFDQFSLYGMDKKINPSKPSDHKVFKVLIDDIEQTMDPSTSATIRRFDISTGEHVIKIQCGDDCLFGGFSLREAQDPKTKYLKGNDSAQVVMQTMDLRPVYYYTKYNSFGETRLLWDGPEAEGFTLSAGRSDGIGDTLMLSGSALCPVGTYKYRVACFKNGVEVNSVSGTFTVKSDIKPLTDTILLAYTDEALDDIRFQYYALSSDNITLTWRSNTPEGITGSGQNGIYVIGGTPTTAGSYPFVVTVEGGNSVEGLITVKTLDLGNNPVLYLYKDNTSVDKNGIYNYLTSTGKNLIARKAKDELRSSDQYDKYDWILISEDVDANNPELLAIARGEVDLPVLNMKGFSYTSDRLDWGEPNNGTLDSVSGNRYNIFVQREDHPIFQSLNWTRNAKKQILNKIDRKGLMPINVDLEGTLCLATAYTRNISDYYKDGELQTILHEIPAAMRPNGKKYLCLPIAQSSSSYLTNDGKLFMNAVVDYLTNNAQTVALPQLEVTAFLVGSTKGVIDNIRNTITVELDADKYTKENLKALNPIITLASDRTFVTPISGETIDFSNSYSFPVQYVVSDYINRRVYNVTISIKSSQGIDEVYTAGEWVNIYDIYGRMITTTNEDVYTMDLPRGMYIVVTSTGDTIKIMR